jgi:spermidine/putrescine transport system permease protein
VRAGRTAPPRALGFLRHHLLTGFAALALGYLFLPIAVVVAFSFNDPAGRFNYTWQGFTLDNWLHPFAYPGLGTALRTSIEIAALSSLAATLLGTLVALTLVRYRFAGSGLTNMLVFVPLTTPEIVLGASLLALFVHWGVPQGFLTILIAHTTFNISYVVVTVKARLAGFDRHLEEAAMDLFANEWTTFFRVTFPLIMPGIVAGALLAFALSIDDFVITYFNAGSTTTFPLFVWGSARVGVPPQINVIGSMIFLVAVGAMLLNVLLQNRRERPA